MLYTENIIPIMSNYTDGNITVSASSMYDNTYSAWKAFNRLQDAGTGNAWATVNATPSGWIKVDFYSTRIITKYTITSRNHTDATPSSPKSWTFEASDDNINWYILDSRSDQINWKPAEKRVYCIDNTHKYRYYRLNIKSNNGQWYTCIDEIEMMANLFQIKNLIKKDSNLYNVDSKWYDKVNKKYIPIFKTVSEQTLIDFLLTNSFYISDIANTVTSDTESFKPLDKFDKPFKVVKIKY